MPSSDIDENFHSNHHDDLTFGEYFSVSTVTTPSRIVPSAWLEHAPFSFWIIEKLKPRIFVELGTHFGYSYFSFCQAIQKLNIYCQCFAVDTWLGDEHSGFYEDNVWNDVISTNNVSYSQFSRLIRSQFSEALKYFSESSIDLLHIDGRHRYEDVKFDFESWLPKLSDRSVVLFHDISVREKDFGVYKFWEEIRSKYPTFEFSHNNGLGVACIGPSAPESIKNLCELDMDSNTSNDIRKVYSTLGMNIRFIYQNNELLSSKSLIEKENENLKNFISDIDNRREQFEFDSEALAAANKEIGAINANLAAANEKIGIVESNLAAVIFERDRLASEGLRYLDQLRALSDELEKAKLIAADLQVQAKLKVELDNELTIVRRNLAAIISQRDRLIAEHAQYFDAVKIGCAAAIDSAMSRCAEIERANLELSGAILASEREIRALRLSTSWRLTQPLRLFVGFLQKSLPAMATLTRYRQMFGVKETIRRLLSFATGRKGIAPTLPSDQEAVPSASPNIQSAFTFDFDHIPKPPSLSGLLNPAIIPTSRVEAGVRRQRSLLFVSGESHTPGHQYRVVRYMDAAREAGHLAECIRLEDISDHISFLDKYDAIIVWRALWNSRLEAVVDAMKAQGGAVVFDIDDLMVEPDLAKTDIIDGIRSQFLTEEAVKDHYTRVRQTMLSADIGFAATERLAFHMRAAGKPSYVLPNGFDQKTHDTSREAARHWRLSKPDDLIRIGYAGGSRTHQKDLGLAIDAVARVLREYPKSVLVLFVQEGTELRLIDIEEYPALAGLEDRIEWRYLQPLEKLPWELARFDINLAPLEVGNPFCESKSELKFFEAALVETPTIASPTEPFRAAIEHGKTGFLALGQEDWYSYIKLLLDSPDARARIGKEAYHAALAKFGPSQRREKYGRVIDSLWGGRVGAGAFALEASLKGARNHRPKIYDSELVFLQEGLATAKVSVVVPLYNYQDYIVETLESIKNQTLSLIDLIIVDGSSTDDSLKVASDWIKRNCTRFNRCVVLQNKSNYGLGYCRNSGVSATETEFYIPVDADNRLLPRCCEQLLAAISKSQAAFCYPTIQQFGATRDLMGGLSYNPQRFVPDNYIDAMAIVSKEAWAMVGGYEHIKGGWEDYDFWVRLAENGLMGLWCPDILAEYRVHQQSMMRTQTLVPKNLRRMQDIFKARHPWVSLGREQAELDLQPPQSLSNLPSAEKARFEKLMPILRCPKTALKMIYDGAKGCLITVDGTTTWAVEHGRPVLMAASDVKIMPEEHISNDLPPEILQMMASTPGLVLNLSAGGTRVKPDNVIEAEFAVFRNTDVVTDAHSLPFNDEVFDLIISMNAFEHYKDPHTVAAELRRVLKPGGKILVRTAFLQPMHEAPWHFYNCTRYGLEHWFEAFEIEMLHVSTNFTPVHTLAWVASDLEAGLRADVSDEAANQFKAASIDDFIQMWRSEDQRQKPLWTNFEQLSQKTQDVTAAGFEMIARKPTDRPVL